jgi:hypothetical protein
VKYVVAAGDGFAPAGIFEQICGEDFESVAWFGAALLEKSAEVGFAVEIADGGSHGVAGGEKLKDDVAADEA